MRNSSIYKFLVCQIIILGMVIPLTVFVTREQVMREYGLFRDNAEESEETANTEDSEKQEIEASEAVEAKKETVVEKEPEIKREVPKIFEDETLQREMEKLASEDDRVFDIIERYQSNAGNSENSEDIEDHTALFEMMIREPGFVDFVYGIDSAKGNETGFVSVEELSDVYPGFVQWDKRWGYVSYGDGIIASTGCAPTAMSIVAMGLTGDRSVTPAKVAKYAEEAGFYVNGVGTDWLFFVRGSKNFGIKGEILRFDENQMKKALDKGHPIILSVGPGDFTQNGHIVVVTGYTEDGFVILDPASKTRSGKAWDFKSLIPQVKQLWEFSL